MTTRRKKTSGSTSPQDGRRRKCLVAALLLILLAVAALYATERRDWPESLRDRATVVTLYKQRDALTAAVRSIGAARGTTAGIKEPIRVRPVPPKPEQGYTPQDRAQLDALLQQEGEQP